MANYYHPHVDIRVDDQSGATLSDNSKLSLHVPFFPIFAPKGQIGQPVIGSQEYLASIFSPDIFEANSALGNIHQMQFMRQAAGSQQVCVLRLDDNSRALGFSLIAIAQQKTVNAYQKDSNGNFVLADSTTPAGQKDAQGYAYQVDKSGTVITDNAYVYSYGLVPLAEDQNGEIKPSDNDVVKAFPDFKSASDKWFEIARLTSTSPGSYVTRSAFALSLATDETDIEGRVGMPMIRFYPKFFGDISFDYLNYQSGIQSFTPTDHYNVFGQPYTDFVINADSVTDPMTSQDVSWNAMLSSAYGTTQTALDYNLVFNVSGGFGAYGNAPAQGSIPGVMALAQHMAQNSTAYTPALTVPQKGDSADKWNTYLRRLQAINVLTGQTLDTPASGVVNSSNLLSVPLGSSTITGALPSSSVSGGTGGQYSYLNAYDTTVISEFMTHNAQNLDKQLQAWANSDGIYAFSDDQQFPITHTYDSGWSLNTKIALMRLMNVRDTLKIDFACDDFSTPSGNAQLGDQRNVVPQRTPFKSDQALSVGSTLMTTIQSYTDSTDSNTRVFRAEIYPQSGTITIGNKDIWVPLSYWRMLSRCSYYSGQAISGSPKGRPRSELTQFRKVSWVPTSKDLKESFWAHGMNCAYYATPTLLFLPDIRTVFNDQTSLLSNGTYSDYIIFMKQIVRNVWTYYSGKDTPVQQMTTQIAFDIDNAASLALGSYMPTRTSVDIQDSNTSAGTTANIKTMCQGTMPDRIWETVLTAVRQQNTTSR